MTPHRALSANSNRQLNFSIRNYVCRQNFCSIESMNDLALKIQNDFRGKRVAVIGDLVADQFLRGTIDRVSREAPVFIMRHDETETRAGGAANAAVNVASLGGTAVAAGLVGNDENGKHLLDVLASSGVDCKFITSAREFRTITKVRVLAGQHYAQRQQVIRIDYENVSGLDNKTAEQLKRQALSAAREADAIIISDYNYGVIDGELVAEFRRIARERAIPLLIDSRLRLSEFKGATAATPNQDEVEHILGEGFSKEDCSGLRRKLDLEALLLTRGNQGILLIEKDRAPLEIDAVGSKQPVDVTGAGDTVIAAFALGLAAGLDFVDSARIANHAGGIVVMKKGTAAAGLDELLKSISGDVERKSQAR